MNNEKNQFRVADYNTIKCKTCIYSVISGTLSEHCCKFKIKPSNVYYESADCPEYTKKPEVIKD